jgi:DNA-binding SARP family transcriptional activator
MEFGILGPLEVRDGATELALGAPKQRAVLALLLLHANQVVPTDRLIDQLWGDQAPDTVKVALQGYVSNLRKALGAGTIVTRAPGYAIELEPERFDLHRFESLLSQARAAAAAGDPAGAAAGFREALGLWRGSALVDFAYEEFAQAPIARLEELRLTALEDRIEADLALGRHAEFVAELETLVAEHPLRERLRGQLMLALYRSARQAEALGSYQQARRALVDELGIEPTQALQDLERAILRQDPALDLPSGAPASAPTGRPSPERAILAVAQEAVSLGAVLTLAAPLARHPPREVILAILVSDLAELPSATAVLGERREALVRSGLTARSAAFTSEQRGSDAARLAGEQSIDLLLVGVPAALVTDEGLGRDLDDVLVGAPCDVAVLLAKPGAPNPGPDAPVLVPFGGAEHEWAAAEIGAWIARAVGAPLQLLGTAGDPEKGRRDASRLLAAASLAVQQVSGVAPAPVIVPPGPEGVIGAAEETGLVALGLSDRWRQEGIGAGRLEVARRSRAPVLFVRGGVRPGGLAPNESMTRYTWSLERETG